MPKENSPVSPTSVLIVEDEAIIAKDMQRRLHKLGYAVAGIATSGAEALDLARQSPPNVVLMDIVLQGELDGVQTAETIRRDQNLPIIFLTAHSDAATLDRAKTTQPYGYLVKPFEERELHTTIEMALYRHQTEATIREQSALLDQARDAILVLDTGGLIRYWNQGAERLYGWKAAEVIGKSPRKFLVGGDSAAWDQAVRNMESSDTWSGELNQQTKAGRSLIVESRWTQLRDQRGRHAARLVLNSDITARKEYEDQLVRSFAAMRNLSVRLQSVREEERARIAREIHDVLAQELTRFKLDLTWMSRRLAQPVEEDVRLALQEKVQASMQQVHGIMQSIQRLAIELRPPILDSLGLAEAIAWEAREFEARSGLSCAIRLPRERPPLDRDQATALFRILQESLTNIMRHAQASRVSISLEEQDAHWVFSITDNGRGITESQASDHRSLGLLGIRERALALGGRSDIRGEPGRGTTVTVRVPVSSPRLEEKALP